MQEQLELLKALQGLDQELNEVRRESGRLETETAGLDAERTRVEAMAATLAADLECLETDLLELKRAIAAEQDSVARAEGRLPAIKTQKEYVAVLKEIDTAKKVNKELQDRIRAKEDEIAALAGEKSEKDAELAEVTSRTADRCSAIAAQVAEVGERADRCAGERDTLLEKLPVTLRKRYQMLIERRNGIAIVAARRGTCCGCNMQLPPQLYNSLFTTKELQSCPHCHRLIYLGED